MADVLTDLVEQLAELRAYREEAEAGYYPA